jgi:hypothetical protein
MIVLQDTLVASFADDHTAPWKDHRKLLTRSAPSRGHRDLTARFQHRIDDRNRILHTRSGRFNSAPVAGRQ